MDQWLETWNEQDCYRERSGGWTATWRGGEGLLYYAVGQRWWLRLLFCCLSASEPHSNRPVVLMVFYNPGCTGGSDQIILLEVYCARCCLAWDILPYYPIKIFDFIGNRTLLMFDLDPVFFYKHYVTSFFCHKAAVHCETTRICSVDHFQCI